MVCLAEPPTTGQVLVLDNNRVLEGDIERVGDQYRIRRSTGETWLPASKVQALCRSLQEAYICLRERANCDDPDERLRLAHWCRGHGLQDQALYEATMALKLRPTHAETRRLVQVLQRPEPAKTETAPATPTEPGSLPPVDFNGETIGLFVTKVQPILMNTCVSCHGGAQSGSFKLTRTKADYPHPRATRQNLGAVFAQIRRDQPQESPILSWAVTVHGDAPLPPIKDRQSPAYRTLEEWVKQAVKATPVKSDVPPPVSVPVHEMPHEPAPAVHREPERTPPTPFAVGSAPPVAEPKPVPEAKPEPLPAADPFDPAIFNQQPKR